MTDNVVALTKDVQIGKDRKQQFLDGVAKAFDCYVESFGEAPDAIVYVMGGTHQTARCGWEIRGGSSGAATTVVALAVMNLTKEIVNPN